MSEEPGDENRLISRLLGEAVKTVFDEWFKPKQFRCLVEFMETGDALHTGDSINSQTLLTQLEAVPGLTDLIASIARELEPNETSPELEHPLQASVAEFILEALHCHNRLNKTPEHGSISYRM